jgi:RNA polymerase sigma-70 factor (ECF subfamily)
MNTKNDSGIPALAELTDDLALAQAAQGDTEAFSVLYERYIGRIYNYIYYRTGNQHEAEDLTARVFFRALGHIGTYRNIGVPFSAWLYRIAHNLVANWYRDHNRRYEVPLEDYVGLPQQVSHPEVELLSHQEEEGLLKVIRKLPPDRQQLVILKFVDNMSNAEIALIMGRSEGAVKSLYHRTLLSMRNEIEKIEK